MNSKNKSIEIQIETKYDSDYESSEEYKSSDDEDEFILLNNIEIYKIYNHKIKYFKENNELKLSKDGKSLYYRYKDDSDSDSDGSSSYISKKFKKFNPNLLIDPNEINEFKYDLHDEIFSKYEYLELEKRIKKTNEDMKNSFTFSKISKVKNPWILDNEFNKDGYDAFINWFNTDKDNLEIYYSLECIIDTVEYKLIKFKSKYIADEIEENYHLYKIQSFENDFTLDKFIEEQRRIAIKIYDPESNDIKRNLHKKICDEKWWTNQSKDYNDKVFCLQCFPNKNYLCIFQIPYKFIFVLSVLFGMTLQLFDLGSDIYVLFDLYSKEIYYFYCCLTIIIITSLVNSFLSMILTSNKNTKPGLQLDKTLKKNDLNQKNKKKIICNFFMGLFQLNIFNEVYYSIKNGEKTHSFIWGRCLEGILESAPQSLFQLFIILKNTESSSMLDLGRYYFSISLSIVSLAIGLVSFEMYRYKEINKYKDEEDVPGIKVLTYLSSYIITLSFFRIFEISSRIIFVALLSYITETGFSIIFFLIVDVILSGYIQYFSDFLPIDDKYKTKLYSNYIKIYNERSSCEKTMIIIHIIILFPFMKLGNLAALWVPFSSKTYAISELNDINLYHYKIKFITDLFCIAMIIYKFIVGGYNTSFMVLSIISMFGFILKNILLFYIKKWTNSKNYISKFAPLKLGCLNNFMKYCCGNKK